MGTNYRTPTTLSGVQSYVTQESHAQKQSGSTILLNVTHSNLTKTRFPEIRLDKCTTISSLKSRLYTHTGTLATSMQLQLLDAQGTFIMELSDDNRPLGYYSPLNNYTIHIIDLDPNSLSKNNALENVDLVKKYRISDEDYEKRPDTYLKFKEQMREKDPTWTLAGSLAGVPPPDKMDIGEEKPKAKVGDRVEVFPGGKRGVVRFVGRDLENLPAGWWIGVEYDEPIGKNDGMVGGVRYFECGKSCGGFARPSKTSVGDFPPLDDDLFSDGDEI